jgi:hypothetical protein
MIKMKRIPVSFLLAVFFFTGWSCSNRTMTVNNGSTATDVASTERVAEPNDPVSADVVEMGTQREIFLDYHLIDRFNGVQLLMHTPYDEGSVMKFDKPWEGKSCTYITIIKDGDLYRAYYRGRKDETVSQVTCYAESKDGKTWVKPELGLFAFEGSKANNIILATEPETHNLSPFLDGNPNSDPAHRFKALGGSGKTGLIPYVSADGVNWKRLKEEGVITKGAFDSQNVSFWSESEGLYVCYFRIFTKERFRSVSRSTSKDFINWSEPVPMSYGDTPPEQLYTQQTSPYFRAPQIYVAIGARFMPNRQILTESQLVSLQVDPSQYKGMSEPYIMTTRGGNVYDRTFMEAFIRPGTAQSNWSGRTNYPALNVVQTGPAEMSLYVNQDYTQPTAHMRRYSMRLDGFSSLNAPYEGGTVTTRPFTFTGKQLEINYATAAAGEIVIEVQDENGIPVPGFTMQQADRLIGNEIARTVSWEGNPGLEKLASKPVRLHVYMKDADLYSIRFK